MPTLPSPADVFRAVNAVVDPVARAGWLAPLPMGVGVISLEVTGRRSGRRLTRPLAALRAGDRILVGTVRRRSDWVANLRADPQPAVASRCGSRTVDAEVRKVGAGSLAVLRLGARTGG